MKTIEAPMAMAFRNATTRQLSRPACMSEMIESNNPRTFGVRSKRSAYEAV